MNNSIYHMDISGKISAGKLINWMIYEARFKQSECQISIQHKYEPNVSRLVVLYYVNDCVYWCLCEEIGKWFMYNRLRKRFNMKFLGHAH